jgi:flagellar assembly protein FliH
MDETDALRERITQLEGELAVRSMHVRQEGVREGEAAFAQKVSLQLDQAMIRCADAVKTILEARHKMRKQMEQDLVHLAIVVAKRILHRELNTDQDALLGLVRVALDKIDMRELHRLRVSPSGARVLEAEMATLHLPSRVEIAADASLEPGAVLLETSRGVLDASIDTQLLEIERGFTDLVRRAP